ncbi:MAG: VOC family protein [Burkholderiaceae bacterium]
MSGCAVRTRRDGSASRLPGWATDLLLCFAAFGSSAAEPPRRSPLVTPSGSEHHAGKFDFVEPITPDPASAKTFHGALFGWTFRDLQVGVHQHAEASLDGRPIAGTVPRPIRSGERRQRPWLNFVAVADVDATRTTAVRNRGRTLSDPHDVAGLGRIAVFADPQGAVFSVLASASGDPPDELAASGEWILASQFTRDPDAAAAFCQTLFDYEVFDLPDPGSDPHLILAAGGYARTAADPLPADDVHAHWLNYVRDVALGGQVLLTPRDDRHGCRIAIVANAPVAPFGLLECRDDRNTQVLQ